MPRFNAPPPDIDSRKAIQLRAREASRPTPSETKPSWPFSADKHPFSSARRGPTTGKPDSGDKAS